MPEIMSLLDALLSQDLVLNGRVTWCWKHFSDIGCSHFFFFKHLTHEGGCFSRVV